mmetsp:Transcript_39930/g.81678  ORF Transcript_39930/g.81678 Transcript_39930/m.81678 type:complete len:222 (-) Transcript_39930:319-984(-)
MEAATIAGCVVRGEASATDGGSGDGGHSNTPAMPTGNVAGELRGEGYKVAAGNHHSATVARDTVAGQDGAAIKGQPPTIHVRAATRLGLVADAGYPGIQRDVAAHRVKCPAQLRAVEPDVIPSQRDATSLRIHGSTTNGLVVVQGVVLHEVHGAEHEHATAALGCVQSHGVAPPGRTAKLRSKKHRPADAALVGSEDVVGVHTSGARLVKDGSAPRERPVL